MQNAATLPTYLKLVETEYGQRAIRPNVLLKCRHGNSELLISGV